MTIEFEVLEYLKSSSSTLDLPQIESMLTQLSKCKLSKTERLQLINLLPKSLVEFHAVVEECEERFSVQEMESILSILNK